MEFSPRKLDVAYSTNRGAGVAAVNLWKNVHRFFVVMEHDAAGGSATQTELKRDFSSASK
jgi:hypothetical protein